MGGSFGRSIGTNNISPLNCADWRACENFTQPMVLVPNTASGQQDNPTLFYGINSLQREVVGKGGFQSVDSNGGQGVSAIAFAPSNPNVLYVGYNDRTIDISANAWHPARPSRSLAPSASRVRLSSRVLTRRIIFLLIRPTPVMQSLPAPPYPHIRIEHFGFAMVLTTVHANHRITGGHWRRP